MTVAGQKDPFRLGFLTTIEVSDGGYVGGLLVTNHRGRPLEFQCTTVVEANRTQEILYGPTLVPFLLSELIGRTLIEKVAVKPHIVFTERTDILDVREYVSVPVAYVHERIAGEPAPEVREHPALTVGRQTLHFHPSHESDCRAIEKQAKLIPGDADLREPFNRVRDALSETTPSGASR